MAWSPGPSSDVGQAEDRLLGAGEDEDLVGLDGRRTARRSRAAGAGGRSTRCSRGSGRPTAPGSRHRPGPAARPSASPGRRTRTAGARRGTPSARSSAPGRSRSIACDASCAAPMLGSAAMSRTIVIAGSPTALGGHFAGMERTPGRAAPARAWPSGSAARPGLRRRRPGTTPGTPRTIRAGVRTRIRGPRTARRSSSYLPRLATHVADRAGGRRDPDARLLVLGGDCTSQVGAMAGLRRARPGTRVGLVWFDAHGDFNTPDTTPSGQRLGHALRDALRPRRCGPRGRR